MKIRKAGLKDFKLIDNFQKKLVSYERKLDPLIARGNNIRYYQEKDIKKTLRSNNALYLIAEIDNKPIGVVMGKIIKTFGNWCIYKKEGYIGQMFIEKEYRGKNTGKKIINDLVKWFKSKGIKSIKLNVYANNKKAIKSYKKYGFKDYILGMRLR